MMRKRGKGETRVGALILLILAVIGGTVFWKQSRYDPRVFSLSPHQESDPSQGLSARSFQETDLSPFMPEGMLPFSPLERFHSENLSDKINGKAEFYLSAGFQSLVAQRFASERLPGQWMEVFLYHMEDHRNAFAVYSGQKRGTAEDLDLTPFAYRTDNALFFAKGPHYVEIIASAPDPTMQDMMLAFAQNMIAELAWEGASLQELDLLPEKGLLTDSVYLISADAFGFEALDNVLTARYDIRGKTMTAFLSMRDSGEEAQSLAFSFVDFLGFFGAESLPEKPGIPHAAVLQVYDAYEVVAHEGPVLFGVHDAPGLEEALELARRMHQKLLEFDW